MIGAGLGAAARLRAAGAVAAVGIALVAALAGPEPAQASGPAITGAGSTWVQIALDQWRAEAARFGLNINYQGVGSTAGRQFFIVNQVDFAASEIPFLPDEVRQLKGEKKSYQYLPDVAGGTALMYNLKDQGGHQVTSLQLSAATIAKIFAGRISSWDDPAIRAENPSLRLPHQHLIPVIRSDGSGTSAKLADYLAHAAPAVWGPFARQYPAAATLPVQYWPNIPGSVAVKGSDGVANFISTSVGQGAIGYVEAGYIYEHSMVPAYIRNASGHYAAPTSANVSAALKHASLNADLTQNLGGVYNAPEANAYPLASYSYLITQTKGMDPAKGAVLGKWILYIACTGQKSAAPLGYSPLPPNLVQAVFSAVRRIPGAPAPPPLTPSGCPNPTITGQGTGGGPQQGPAVNPPTSSTPSGGTQTSGGTGSGGSGNGSGGTGSNGGNATSTGGSSTKQSPAKVSAATLAAAGAGATAAGLSVPTLSDAERQAALDAAIKDAAAQHAGSSQESLLAGFGLLGALLIPAFVLRGRKPLGTGDPTGGDE